MASHRADRPAGRRPSSRRGTVAAVLVAMLVGLLLGGSRGSLAFWTDTDQVTAGTFSTGTLQLNVDGQTGPTHSASTTLTMAAMTPGESVAVRFAITNSGNASFTWLPTVSTPASNLSPYLVVATSHNATIAGQATTYPRQQTCSGGTAFNPGSPPLLAVGGATQYLCVQVTLPSNVGNAAQNLSGFPLTITVDATQKLA